MNNDVAKFIILIGIGLTILGFVILIFPNIFNWFGRLPGDIHVKNDRSSFHFPIVTCIVVSVVVSIILSFLKRG